MAIQYNHTSGSIENGIPAVPNDLTILPKFRGLYVGGTGNIVLQHVSGVSVTYTAVPVGMFPISGVRVMATGTTATNIVALY